MRVANLMISTNTHDTWKTTQAERTFLFVQHYNILRPKFNLVCRHHPTQSMQNVLNIYMIYVNTY